RFLGRTVKPFFVIFGRGSVLVCILFLLVVVNFFFIGRSVAIILVGVLYIGIFKKAAFIGACFYFIQGPGNIRFIYMDRLGIAADIAANIGDILIKLGEDRVVLYRLQDRRRNFGDLLNIINAHALLFPDEG